MNMKNLFIIIFLFLFLFCSCRENEPISYKESDSRSTSEYEGGLLLSAFKTNSVSKLTRFFENWEEQYIPDESYTPEDIRNKIYSLFSAFYIVPDDYKDSEYLVLQNSINYCYLSPAIYDSNYFYIPDSLVQKSIINNFTPHPNNLSKKIIYLSQKYSEALNYYFNEYSVTDSTYDYNKYSSDYIAKKEDFLKKKIIVKHSHWFPSYYYCSFPMILFIYFNYDATKAKILFRDSWDTGGMDEYQYNNSKWEKIRRIFSWIE
jgi:hypothetical protein